MRIYVLIKNSSLMIVVLSIKLYVCNLLFLIENHVNFSFKNFTTKND